MFVGLHARDGVHTLKDNGKTAVHRVEAAPVMGDRTIAGSHFLDLPQAEWQEYGME
jgi:hypothetical protein